MSTVLDDIEADLSILYDPEFGFAEYVVGPDGYLLGVFSNEYLEAEPGASIGVRSAVPVLRTRTDDSLSEGDSVSIRGNDYTVIEPQPDGYGETIHILRAT